MKKIFSIVLIAFAALSIFTSCKNEMDEIFSESAAERLNHTQAKYSKLLTSSKNGWAFEYYPTASADDGAVLYALKFSTDGSVDVAGDPFVTGEVQNEISCWDIIADNGPVLSFSTYNKLIHQFSDPLDDGMGYEGDYEFAFVYSDTENPDSVIMLKGKKRGLYSRLKMIDEEVTPLEYLNDISDFQKTYFPSSAPNYLLVHLGDSLVRMDDVASTTPTTYGFGKDAVLFGKTNSYITTKYNGVYTLRFNRPFEMADGTKCYNFNFIKENNELVAENDSRVKITGPVANDFLYDRLIAGASMTFSGAMECSDNINNALADVKKAFTDVKYTFNSIQFKYSDKVMRATVSYRNAKKQNVSSQYTFELSQQSDGSISFKYLEPVNAAGETLLNSIPAIGTFFQAIEGTYNVESAETPLNLKKVKFTSASSYFVIAPVYPKSDDSGIQ